MTVIRLRLFCGMLLLAATLVSTGVFADTTVSLVSGLSPIDLAGKISMLRDESAALSIDDVRSDQFNQSFVITEGKTIINGFTDSAYWYRVDFSNPSVNNTVSNWVMALRCPWLDNVDFYVVSPDGNIRHFEMGDHRPLAEERVPFTASAIPLDVPPGDAVRVYLRVHTGDVHLVELSAWTNKGFFARTYKLVLWYGLVFGILFVMFLYNLFLYLSVRDRAYLLYTGYVFFALTTVAGFEGMHRIVGQEIFRLSPMVVDAWIPWSAMLLGLFSLLFAMDYLKLKSNLNVLYKVCCLLAGLFLVMLVAIPFLPMNISSPLSISLGIVSLTVGFCSAIYLFFFRSIVFAKYFLIAEVFGLVGGLISVLSVYELFPHFPYAFYAFELGICLDMTLMSLALGARINYERDERLLARESVSRMKNFLPDRVADMVASPNGDEILRSRRQTVTVCVIELRGFFTSSEISQPEDVIQMLSDFFTAMGEICEQYGGAIEHFSGESMVVLFNAPVKVEQHELQAIRASLTMQTTFAGLRSQWYVKGLEVGMRVGIASGYANVGVMGFSKRVQYAVIGSVTKIAEYLCSEAGDGEVLATSRVAAIAGLRVAADLVEQKYLDGFYRPIEIVRIRDILVAEDKAAGSI